MTMFEKLFMKYAHCVILAGPFSELFFDWFLW